MPGFRRDSRANRLENFAVMPDASGHQLWLRGPLEAVPQVLLCDPRYVDVTHRAVLDPQWTHHLWGSGGSMSPDTAVLVSLLREVLTLPAAPNLDFAITLDWYKVPEEGVPGDRWANSRLGELVHRGKYWYKVDPDGQRAVGLPLVGALLEIIQRHPVLRQADWVAAVPGHDQELLNFGARAAATVARDLQLPLARVRCINAYRPEAKALPRDAKRQMLSNTFRCDDDLTNQTVLIVDDVYASGSTMCETARALRAAGATAVYGLTAVRTMRA
jgi:hypothetical protein